MAAWGCALALLFIPAATATPTPTSVTVAGSMQSEIGGFCLTDWDPACVTTHMVYDANDDVWQNTFSIPAGSWEYKAALNDSWTENYGLHAQAGGANIPLSLGGSTAVKFFYDHKSHWITDNVNSVIATVPGSFQSELGCSGDWQPDCLRSWLQDPDGNGTYSFETTALPAGSYEAKVAINEDWTENYGLGGVLNGPNIPFTVPADNARMDFVYNPTSHVLTITSPTAVSFASASATRTAKGVLVRWRTGTEAELLGFRVYRSRGHSWQRLTRSLIAAKGSVSGHSYGFLDRTARRGVSPQYRIRAVNRDGTAAWFGPVRGG